MIDTAKRWKRERNELNGDTNNSVPHCNRHTSWREDTCPDCMGLTRKQFENRILNGVFFTPDTAIEDMLARIIEVCHEYALRVEKMIQEKPEHRDYILHNA